MGDRMFQKESGITQVMQQEKQQLYVQARPGEEEL